MILGRFWISIFAGLMLMTALSSCTKPTELEAELPESSGTVAAPSGSPVVTQLNSTTPDGAYKAGDTVLVRVTFGLAATVTGTPRLLLDTGATPRYATYTSGSGGVTIVFTYVVQAGDASSDLNYINVNALELNGGTITASNGDTMNLVLPGLSGDGSLATNRALVIDTTDPVATGAVTDGTYYNSTTSSPSLTWAAATDTGGSGIAKYQVAVGTSVGGTQALTWTDIGNVTTYQVTSGMTLTEGSTYYASIRAVDLAGNISNVINSDGWIVDTTAPTTPATVYDGVSSYSTTESLLISWAASTDIGGSGIANYELAIGTAAGGTDVLNWTSIGVVTSYTRTSLSLSVGTTYYASIRAIDYAGNIATAQGDGWQVVTCNTYGWCPQAYLKAANAEAGDEFGASVAIDGDTAVVATLKEDSNQTTITNGTTASSDNSATEAGAIYVFKRTGVSWAQEAYLKPPNTEAGDSFGWSISIHEDTLVVGANGEDSNQTTITNGTTASSNNSMLSAGAVYVFKRTGTTWAQQAYLKAPNANAGDIFGGSVSVHGDTIVVGAVGEGSDQTTITNGTTASSTNAISNAGAAYVFKRTGVNWAQEAYFKPQNPTITGLFGASVSVHGDTVAVGFPIEPTAQTTITNGMATPNTSATVSGAVYVYKRSGVNWAQEAFIKPSNNEAVDMFGMSIGLDNDTLVVHAPLEDSSQITITHGPTASSDNSAVDSGAVYVFKRTGVNWAQEAYIKTANGKTGSPVVRGDVLAVRSGDASRQSAVTDGATAHSDTSSVNSGAVFIYKRTGSTWAQESFIKSPNSDADDAFGNAIGISGDTLVVGATGEDSNQTTITNGITASSDNSASNAGAAYVFTVIRQATWQQQAYMKAPNAGSNDFFGKSVAVSGDTTVVGAPNEDSNQTTVTNGDTASSNNSAADAGAVYVFKRTGMNWDQEAYIKPSNAGSDDKFGNSVGISEDTIVVGAYNEDSAQTTITNGTSSAGDFGANESGAAYVFKRTGTTWAQEAYLKAPNAETMDLLGNSVAISGDTIVAGAHLESSNQTIITNGTTASANNSAAYAGAAYVFKRTGVNWAHQAYLKAANAEGGDYFGMSVAISGDTIAVASFNESSNQTTITNGTTASADNSAAGSGAVYVFKRTGATWAQEAYIKPSNSEAGDAFGLGMSIDRDTLVVGAYNEASNQTTITNGTTSSSDNSAAGSGAAYVYKRTGTTWVQEAYLKAANTEAADTFGRSAAVKGNTIAIGAVGEDSNQTTITNGPTASSNNSLPTSGAVYVYKRTGSNWAQEAYVKAANAGNNDWFGIAVSIDLDTLAVGAFYESSNQTTITNGTTASSDNSVFQSGAVYIYQR